MIRRFPNYVMGDTLTSLLQMHMALYQEEKIKQNNDFQFQLVTATLPRTYLELGLLEGETSKVAIGIKDENLSEYKPGEAIVLALKEEGLKVDYLHLLFQKAENDYQRWKEWRVQGICNDLFQEFQFPTYNMSAIDNIDKETGTAILKTNIPLFIEAYVPYSVFDQKGKFKVLDREEQNLTALFFYHHKITVPEEIINILDNSEEETPQIDIN